MSLPPVTGTVGPVPASTPPTPSKEPKFEVIPGPKSDTWNMRVHTKPDPITGKSESHFISFDWAKDLDKEQIAGTMKAIAYLMKNVSPDQALEIIAKLDAGEMPYSYPITTPKGKNKEGELQGFVLVWPPDESGGSHYAWAFTSDGEAYKQEIRASFQDSESFKSELASRFLYGGKLFGGNKIGYVVDPSHFKFDPYEGMHNATDLKEHDITITPAHPTRLKHIKDLVKEINEKYFNPNVLATKQKAKEAAVEAEITNDQLDRERQAALFSGQPVQTTAHFGATLVGPPGTLTVPPLLPVVDNQQLPTTTPVVQPPPGGWQAPRRRDQ